MSFPPIDPEEIKVAEMDFSPDLPAGVTLGSVVMSVAVLSGADPLPSNVILGVPLIVGGTVKTRLKGQVNGVVYEVRAVATDSAGNKHVMAKRLECARMSPQ